MTVGPDGFIAELAAYGAAPTTKDRHVVYKVEVVEGRYAGQVVETAVAYDELARWPLVPPHWIYLLNDVTFAVTNTQPCSIPATVSVESEGFIGGNPHAQHFHIGGTNECPNAEDVAGDDDLISTAEGTPAYGEVKVSLTTEGASTQPVHWLWTGSPWLTTTDM